MKHNYICPLTQPEFGENDTSATCSSLQWPLRCHLMNIIAKTVARNLRVLRGLRGRTQAELANRIGVSRRTIARIEGEGSSPNVDRVHAAAADLGVTPNMLTSRILTVVTIPVPLELRAKIMGPDGAGTIERIVQLLEET